MTTNIVMVLVVLCIAGYMLTKKRKNENDKEKWQESTLFHEEVNNYPSPAHERIHKRIHQLMVERNPEEDLKRTKTIVHIYTPDQVVARLRGITWAQHEADYGYKIAGTHLDRHNAICIKLFNMDDVNNRIDLERYARLIIHELNHAAGYKLHGEAMAKEDTEVNQYVLPKLKEEGLL